MSDRSEGMSDRSKGMSDRYKDIIDSLLDVDKDIMSDPRMSDYNEDGIPYWEGDDYDMPEWDELTQIGE